MKYGALTLGIYLLIASSTMFICSGVAAREHHAFLSFLSWLIGVACICVGGWLMYQVGILI